MSLSGCIGRRTGNGSPGSPSIDHGPSHTRSGITLRARQADGGTAEALTAVVQAPFEVADRQMAPCRSGRCASPSHRLRVRRETDTPNSVSW